MLEVEYLGCPEMTPLTEDEQKELMEDSILELLGYFF